MSKVEMTQETSIVNGIAVQSFMSKRKNPETGKLETVHGYRLQPTTPKGKPTGNAVSSKAEFANSNLAIKAGVKFAQKLTSSQQAA